VTVSRTELKNVGPNLDL